MRANRTSYRSNISIQNSRRLFAIIDDQSSRRTLFRKRAFLSGSEVEDIPKNSPRPINLVTRNFQKKKISKTRSPTLISIEPIRTKDRPEHG